MEARARYRSVSPVILRSVFLTSGFPLRRIWRQIFSSAAMRQISPRPPRLVTIETPRPRKWEFSDGRRHTQDGGECVAVGGAVYAVHAGREVAVRTQHRRVSGGEAAVPPPGWMFF